jgi:hypothetical protein
MKAETKNDDLTLCFQCSDERWNYQDPEVELRDFLGRIFCDECGKEI